MQFRYNIKL